MGRLWSGTGCLHSDEKLPLPSLNHLVTPKLPKEAQAENGRCLLNMYPCGCHPGGCQEVAEELPTVSGAQQQLFSQGRFFSWCSAPTEASVGRWQWAGSRPGWLQQQLPALPMAARGLPVEVFQFVQLHSTPAAGHGGFLGSGAVSEGTG